MVQRYMIHMTSLYLKEIVIIKGGGELFARYIAKMPCIIFFPFYKTASSGQ